MSGKADHVYERVPAASSELVDLAPPAFSAPRTRPIVENLPKREDMLGHIEATQKLGPCQVRSKTDHPCPHQAVVKIWGLSFCKPCAREQEAYFAIGELMQEAQGLCNAPLIKALDRVRWERTGYTAVAETEKAKVMLESQE
jgi:hypothetical protein